MFEIGAIACKAVLSVKSWILAPDKAPRRVVLGGQELPSQVGAVLPGPIRALCLGPDEWLIMSQDYTAAAVRLRLGSEAQDLVMVDMTDGLAGLSIQGSAARDMLSQGCGLDFHPDVFPADSCARTRFAQIPVVIQRLAESNRFELYCGRSYLQYLRAWLTDASAVTGPVAPRVHPRA
jgi:heterotetrameric sarcosine oxidase gamma subunit